MSKALNGIRQLREADHQLAQAFTQNEKLRSRGGGRHRSQSSPMDSNQIHAKVRFQLPDLCELVVLQRSSPDVMTGKRQERLSQLRLQGLNSLQVFRLQAC
jgi:hypothetical protein